jgi:MFS family permease
MTSATPGRQPIPRTVWALGFVSLFMDVSSEIVHALLPLFLTTTLGASVVIVGVIDGIAESTASIAKVFSGWISDKIGRRKPLIVLGYGLAALSKPLFPLASSAPLVLLARFADRIGKGIRGAPRDALIADVTPNAIRGRAFGLRQSLDTVGAFVGPLLAIALMAAFANDMRAVLWFAVIPAAASFLVALLAVDERERIAAPETASKKLRFDEVRRLGPNFAYLLGIGVIFTLARFSEAFLILKAVDAGVALALAPLAMIVMNLFYAAGAYPAGVLSDSVKPRRLLILGLAVLMAADALLALSANMVGVFLGIALWGAHMALTQGLLAKLIADAAPDHLRGTAFGIFNLGTGLALLVASVLAGIVWEAYGPKATFVLGGVFALLAAVMLLFWSDPSTERS